MAFKISAATTGTYKWPVHVFIPMDGGKRKDAGKFTATFNRFKRDEDPTEDSNLTAVEMYKKLICDWEGVQDDDGNEIPFTDDNLEELLKVDVFSVAILNAYRESIGQAKEKN